MWYKAAKQYFVVQKKKLKGKMPGLARHDSPIEVG
jgi:hypothetical protein